MISSGNARIASSTPGFDDAALDTDSQSRPFMMNFSPPSPLKRATSSSRVGTAPRPKPELATKPLNAGLFRMESTTALTQGRKRKSMNAIRIILHDAGCRESRATTGAADRPEAWERSGCRRRHRPREKNAPCGQPRPFRRASAGRSGQTTCFVRTDFFSGQHGRKHPVRLQISFRPCFSLHRLWNIF